MTKLKCTLCEDQPWIALDEVLEHLESLHASLPGVMRWPDGGIVVIDHDQLDQGLT